MADDDNADGSAEQESREELLARRQEAQDAGDGATVNEVDERLAELDADG